MEGEACRRLQEGSGFAIATDVVLTNAHVVAGERRTDVLLPSGRRLPAVVVTFDANRDLALLDVPGLGQAPLPLSGAPRPAGGRQGRSVRPSWGPGRLARLPGADRQDVVALGRDLYDSHDTRRDVFILASNLIPGDSGGALVDQRGTVVGVAFAIAPDRPGTSYALTAREIRAVLRPPGAGTAVPTGPCLTEG